MFKVVDNLKLQNDRCKAYKYLFNDMKEIIEKYKEKQITKLIIWAKENPGKVMNNYDIRINVCNIILDGEFTIPEMEIVKEACYLLHRARKGGMSGWYVSGETYEELIKLCKNG